MVRWFDNVRAWLTRRWIHGAICRWSIYIYSGNFGFICCYASNSNNKCLSTNSPKYSTDYSTCWIFYCNIFVFFRARMWYWSISIITFLIPSLDLISTYSITYHSWLIKVVSISTITIIGHPNRRNNSIFNLSTVNLTYISFFIEVVMRFTATLSITSIKIIWMIKHITVYPTRVCLSIEIEV